MQRLAIIGTGISGIACAHYLKDRFKVTLFDKNDYPGGHTHTHNMGDFTLDTGFIVCNLQTYPNLLKLFRELHIKLQKSDMSFAVFNQRNGLQYAGSSLNEVFAQRHNIVSISHWRFLFEIRRFFRIAVQERNRLSDNETIKTFCSKHKLSMYFVDNFIAPMSSAIWSTSTSRILDFPVKLLLPFMFNHGLLGTDTQFQWYVVKGGSNAYVKAILSSGKIDVHLGEPVQQVSEQGRFVSLKTNKNEYKFDKVIVAAHADESVSIVTSLSEEHRGILNLFKYNKNKAVLHTDASIMPPLRRVWSSWNVIMDNKGRASTVYWLNRLQKPKTNQDFFLSIDPFQNIEKKKIIKTIDYEHPLFTSENYAVQSRLRNLNKNTGVYFTGSYFGYGFHEDGLKSALEVVKILK